MSKSLNLLDLVSSEELEHIKNRIIAPQLKPNMDLADKFNENTLKLIKLTLVILSGMWLATGCSIMASLATTSYWVIGLAILTGLFTILITRNAYKLIEERYLTCKVTEFKLGCATTALLSTYSYNLAFEKLNTDSETSDLTELPN